MRLDGAPNSDVHDALVSGLKNISNQQGIVFKAYRRTILPVDKSVFLIRDLNVPDINANGSLHYSTDQQQNEDETIGLNRVVFTTDVPLEQFNAIADNTVWIADKDSIRFAFTSRGNLYQNAQIYGYTGDAIYPVMFSQIIDDPNGTVDIGGQIVSNSLPFWLSIALGIDVYPSHLVPANLRTAYASIHIEEGATEALARIPYIDPDTSDSWQLVKDRVRLTFYGMRASAVSDAMNAIYETFNNDVMSWGLLDCEAVQDAKRTQSELGIIAQKKTWNVTVCYHQHTARNIAKQLILSALPNIIVSDI